MHDPVTQCFPPVSAHLNQLLAKFICILRTWSQLPHCCKYFSALGRGQRHDHVAAFCGPECLLELCHQLKVQVDDVIVEPLGITVHTVVSVHVGVLPVTGRPTLIDWWLWNTCRYKTTTHVFSNKCHTHTAPIQHKYAMLRAKCCSCNHTYVIRCWSSAYGVCWAIVFVCWLAV
jgi:hypothetical protein